MADKIQVAVRVRPVLFQKKDVEVHWGTEKGMVVQLDPSTRKRIGNPYLFDLVFGTDTQNQQIFNSLVRPLVDSAMEGFNVTVLAYGQTASGKTYTMMGSQQEFGIVQLVVERIFTVIESQPEREFLLRCSYIEIYNETISDLLSSTHQKLKVQELAEGHVIVQNLSETNVNSTDAVLKLMQQGNKQRKVGGTSMNERSSRSHTIFRIIVESRPCSDDNDAAVIVSHINLVDLAGSEKASQTNATGDRFREGCAINTSLSALSLVIKQLSEKEGFVNFRDSKLTHILRASLGGNARTAIICNVTPTVLDETSSTLKFASSAKTVQNQPHANEVYSDQALLRKYNNYIKDLEKKLKEKEHQKKPEAIEEMQRLLQEKDLKINELKQQLVVSSASQSAISRNTESLSAVQRSLRRMTWGGNRLKQAEFSRFDNVPFTPAGARGRSSFATPEINSPSSPYPECFIDATEFFVDSGNKRDVATMTDCLSLASPFKGQRTPVPVLRERVHSLRQTLEEKEKENEDLKGELNDLCSFTRLEQEIGVHFNLPNKVAAADESSELLRLARQTANDMEVMYMDAQRKLSELQTEYKEKELHYEEELQSQEVLFGNQLAVETAEKKRLAKELAVLTEAYDRLQKDHAENDIHLNIMTERQAKREADLRQNLQEAWSQLEILGQDPSAIKESSAAKRQLEEMEKQLQNTESERQKAEMQIRELTEELRLAKESVPNFDNSLGGMCLADELRDIVEEDCSFVARQVRPRKRPSSILSVALAKMEQSSVDLSGCDVEPKKTRLSMTQPPAEEAVFDVKEIANIREHLLELQNVLERYESDFEVLSQEKAGLLNQLSIVQQEVLTLRSSANIKEKIPSIQAELEKIEESFNCPMAEESMDLSTSEDVPENNLSMEWLATQRALKEVEAEKRKLMDQILELKRELTLKDAELNESRLSLERVVNMIKENEQNASKEEMEHELKNFKQSYDDALANIQQLLEEKHSLEENWKVAREELAVVRQELISAQQITEAAQLKDPINSSEEELTSTEMKLRQEIEEYQLANDKFASELAEATRQVSELQSELDSKTEDLKSIAASLREEFESSLTELNKKAEEYQQVNEKLGCDLTESTRKVDELQSKLDSESDDSESIEAKLREEFESVLNDLNSKSNEYLQVNEKLVSDLAESTKKVEQLQSELESKTEYWNSVEAKQRESELSINDLTRITEENQQVNAKLASELAETSKKLDQLESKTEDLKSIEAKLQREFESSLDELNNQTAEYKLMNEKLASDLTESTKRVEELQSELNSKIEELESIEAKLREEYKCSLNEIDTKSEGHQMESVEAKLREEFESSLDELSNKSEEYRQLNEQLVSQLTESKDKLDELQAELNSTTDELKSIERKLREEFETTLNDLNEKSEEYQQVNERLVSELTETTRKVDELQSELDSKTEDLKSIETNLREEFESTLNDLNSKSEEYQQTNEKLVSDLAESNRRVDELQSELNSKIDNLNSIEAKLREEFESSFSELNSKSEEYQRVNEKLFSDLAESTQKIEQLQSELESRTDNLKSIEAQLREGSQSSNDLNEKHEEYRRMNEKLVSDLAESTKKVDQLQSELDTRIDNMKSAESKLREEYQSSSNELNITRLALESANSKSEEYQELIEKLTMDIDDATNRIDHLQSQLDCKTTALEMASNELESQASKLQQILNEMDSMRSEISSSNDLKSLVEELRRSSANETSQLTCRIRQLEEEGASYQRQLQTHEDVLSQNEQLSRQVDELQSHLERGKTELSNLKMMADNCVELETRLCQRDETLAQLSQDLEHKAERIRRLEEKLVDSNSSQQNHLEQLSSLEEIIRDGRTHLEKVNSSLEAMQSKNDHLTSQLNDKEEENIQLRNSLEATKKRIEAGLEQFQSIRSDKMELVQQVELFEKEMEAKQLELEHLTTKLLAFEEERDVFLHLKQRFDVLQTRNDTVTGECNHLKELHAQQLQREEDLHSQMQVLSSQLHSLTEKNSQLEESQLRAESHNALLKQNLTDLQQQLEALQVKHESDTDTIKELNEQIILLKERITQLGAKAASLENEPHQLVQSRLKETIVTLKSDLVATQSKMEVLRLNFETEEETRKKKIERLEKDLELMKQQYAKCKEELRLTRYRSFEDGTVNIQQKTSRPQCITTDVQMQTDPISDKGFGFRWQMEQFVSDNERLRKKVSELGERMEFYKEKLLKYRNLYFQVVGQDPNTKPSVSSNDVSREHQPAVKLGSQLSIQERPPSDVIQPIASSELLPDQVFHEDGVKVNPSSAVPSSKWSGSSSKKEPLTKEEMEKINNCNPS